MKFSIEHFRMKNGIFINRSEALLNNKPEDFYDTAFPNPNSIFIRNITFYSLIFDNYELATNSMEINLDLASQLFKYSGSYLWYITTLFEIFKVVVIKTPLKTDTSKIIAKVTYLNRTEKLIKMTHEKKFSICNIELCYHTFLEIEKLEKLLIRV